jgi:hypothetical protein
MSEPTPYALSKHFTNLIGRKVTFAQMTSALETKAKQVYGIYTVFPMRATLVVKADLALMGSFAGALVGLPDAEVKQHLATNPIEELLRDAIYEVFNVAAAVITTEGRATLTAMVTDQLLIRGAAEKALSTPLHRSYFNVAVEGYQGGRFNVLS